MNYEGKRKRAMGRTRMFCYKYRDFKKAIVTFDSSLTDVGRSAKLGKEDQDDDSDEIEQEEEKEVKKLE